MSHWPAGWAAAYRTGRQRQTALFPERKQDCFPNASTFGASLAFGAIEGLSDILLCSLDNRYCRYGSAVPRRKQEGCHLAGL